MIRMSLVAAIVSFVLGAVWIPEQHVMSSMTAGIVLVFATLIFGLVCSCTSWEPRSCVNRFRS